MRRQNFLQQIVHGLWCVLFGDLLATHAAEGSAWFFFFAGMAIVQVVSMARANTRGR